MNPNPLAGDEAPDVDRELVEQAQGASRDALEQLVARHQRWIYNVVLRMIYLPQDAEDITQEPESTRELSTGPAPRCLQRIDGKWKIIHSH
jgi:hypothetical protein